MVQKSPSKQTVVQYYATFPDGSEKGPFKSMPLAMQAAAGTAKASVRSVRTPM